jgi:hypothetical protein
MGPLEAIRLRLELLAADIGTAQRMLPPDIDEEVVDQLAQARLAVEAALAVFKKRDRDIQQTFGSKG